MSPDGHITAYFGDQSAATSCPKPTTCTVVVPQPGTLPAGAGGPGAAPAQPPASGTVSVTLVTAAGRSNAVTFTYG